MGYIAVYKEIIFIEGEEPLAKELEKIEYKKRFSFNSQIKTLDCVKDQLAEQAIKLGGNAVVKFKYGQKSYGWFRASLCSIDDNIKWYGNGVVAIIPEERKKEILEKLNK